MNDVEERERMINYSERGPRKKVGLVPIHLSFFFLSDSSRLNYALFLHLLVGHVIERESWTERERERESERVGEGEGGRDCIHFKLEITIRQMFPRKKFFLLILSSFKFMM